MREKLIELLDMNCGYVSEMKAEELADYLLQNGVSMPTRCKDCKYCEEWDYFGKIRYRCVGKWDISQATCAEVELDDYCSYAERKDEILSASEVDKIGTKLKGGE